MLSRISCTSSCTSMTGSPTEAARGFGWMLQWPKLYPGDQSELVSAAQGLGTIVEGRTGEAASPINRAGAS
jgi:hypothetical protein